MAINLANNNSLANITALPSSISGGAMTLISEQTASGSANLSFTSGIDDTYDSYVFKFINIHPATDEQAFKFQGSVNTGSSYGVSMTSTCFNAYHAEDNSEAALSYQAGSDLANGTGFQDLHRHCSNSNDGNLGGELMLFNPSSTTFVKHFTSKVNGIWHSPGSMENFSAGYFNTTSAIDAIQFKFASGNIDSGVIKLYGIS